VVVVVDPDVHQRGRRLPLANRRVQCGGHRPAVAAAPVRHVYHRPGVHPAGDQLVVQQRAGDHDLALQLADQVPPERAGRGVPPWLPPLVRRARERLYLVRDSQIAVEIVLWIQCPDDHAVDQIMRAASCARLNANYTQHH
jgi:hypothetical protein